MNNFLKKYSFSLLNADHVHLNKSWNYRNVVSPFYRMYLIDGGQGILSTTKQNTRLEAGYLYLIPSFTICNYQCDDYLDQSYLHLAEESMDGTSLFLWNRKIFCVKARKTDYKQFKRLLRLNPGRGLVKSSNPRDYEKGQIIAGFQELNNLLSPSAFTETQGIILQLLSRFLTSEHFHLEKKGEIPTKISQVIHHIQTKLQEEITVAGLATMAQLNPDYFSRVFTDYMGERPLVYLQLKRIERAQFLITTTHLPFTEIAVQTGFETLSYFSRTFKKVTGQTPGAYRQYSRKF